MDKKTVSDVLRMLVSVLILGAVVSLFPIFKTHDPEVTRSLILAPLVMGVNFAAGMFLIKKGFSASHATFMKIVFGGMGIRLLVLGAIIAAVIAHEKLNFMTFLIAMLGYYIVFMYLEIWYVHTRLSVETDGRNDKR